MTKPIEDWPLPDRYLAELGRITIAWGTLENTLRIAVIKMVGLEPQGDARPHALLLHNSAQQTINAFKTMCNFLVEEFPNLQGAIEKFGELDRLQTLRNMLTHQIITHDAENECIKVGKATARGKFKFTEQQFDLGELQEESRNCHRLMIAIHNSVHNVDRPLIF